MGLFKKKAPCEAEAKRDVKKMTRLIYKKTRLEYNQKLSEDEKKRQLEELESMIHSYEEKILAPSPLCDGCTYAECPKVTGKEKA